MGDESHQNEAPTVEWQVHPIRDRKGAGLSAVAVVALIAWLSYVLMGSLGWALFAAVVLVAALNQFFFPVKYRVDREGVGIQSLWTKRRYAWSEIRRFRYDEGGGFLSRRARPSFLDSWSGLSLQFSGNCGEVVSAVRHYLKEEGDS